MILMVPELYPSNKENGRLGLTKLPRSTQQHVPFPTELRIPGARIVSLIAGGMYVSHYVFTC